MIRAAILDLDGTLIGKSEEVSDRVAGTVSELSQKIPITIATGREPAHAIKFARQLGFTSPQISDGGASILDPAAGQSLWSVHLAPEDAREIVSSLEKWGTAFIATNSKGSVTGTSQVTDWNLIRVSALDLNETGADGLLAQFDSNPALQLVKVFLPYNDLWAVDFTRSGVDKASGVLRLSQMIGVDPRDMVAAGDSYNDVPLLRLCGLSIAMGDAPDEVKALADYVAPSVEEDGLAVAIEEWVLPRL